MAEVKLEGFNKVKIKARLYDNEKTLLYATERFAQMTDRYVPYLEGDLSTTYRVLPGLLIYTQPYSKRLYYGGNFNFTKDHHPLATHHWDVISFKTNKGKLVQEIEAFIRRNAK